MAFKVGDRVKIVGKCEGHGSIGEIVEIADSESRRTFPIKVMFGENTYMVYREHELELQLDTLAIMKKTVL